MSEEQTNLALVGGASTVNGRSISYSKGLWRLLTEGEDARVAIRAIALNPKFREEVRSALPALASDLAPAEREPVLTELVKHALVFGVPDRSSEEWATVFGVYVKALEDFSLLAIRDAFERWNRGEMYPKDFGRHAFYPKPAELVALAGKHRAESIMASYRARKALEHVEKGSFEMTPERRREERQKAIDAGLLTPDGKLNMDYRPKSVPTGAKMAQHEARRPDSSIVI